MLSLSAVLLNAKIVVRIFVPAEIAVFICLKRAVRAVKQVPKRNPIQRGAISATGINLIQSSDPLLKGKRLRGIMREPPEKLLRIFFHNHYG